MAVDSRIQWSGRESLAEAEEILERHREVIVILARDYHHALCRRLRPQEPGAPEALDIAGGVELLERIAGVGGLQEIGGLAQVIGGRKAEIRLTSPAPTIRIVLHD